MSHPANEKYYEAMEEALEEQCPEDKVNQIWGEMSLDEKCECLTMYGYNI